jgi:diphthine synthase
MLTIIGVGLDDDEITLKGIKALEDADRAYAEFYTNTKTVNIPRIEEKTGTEIEELSREEVEQEETLIRESENKDVCFLVSGDPLTATTHYDIKHQAEQSGIDVEIVHAPSILTSVAETGLNVYKFGRVVTLPEEGEPDSIIEMIEKNDSIGLHTLVLLDIDYRAENATEKLTEMNEDLKNRKALALERANSENQEITLGSLEELSNKELGETPHCIVIVGETSFKEEEFLESCS